MRECKKIKRQIQHILLGEKLTEEENNRFSAHLERCSECRKIYEQEQQFDKFLQVTLEPYQLKKDLVQPVLARLTFRSPQRVESKRPRAVSWLYGHRWVWVSAVVTIFVILLSVTVANFYIQYTKQIVVIAKHGIGVSVIPQGSTEPVSVQVGTQLHPGDQLITNPWSRVAVRAGRGTQIWLNQKTNIQVGVDTAYAFSIQTGELLIEQSRWKPEYRIKTPAGFISPIGTRYDIQVAENSTTHVAVIDGEVQFKNNVGTIVVPAGYGSEASVTQVTAPTPPVQIDTPKYTDWIDNFKQISLYSPKQREQLAREAYAAAQKLVDAQQYYDALTTYRRVTELMPEWAIAYSGMGYCYYEMEQYADGVSVCYQALSIDPNSSNARYYLVLILAHLDRYEEARPYAELLVKQVPSEHAYSILLGEIYLHLGYLDSAEQWYRHGLTQSPCEICARVANEGLAKIAKLREQQKR